MSWLTCCTKHQEHICFWLFSMCWWRWWWSVSLEGMITKPSMANSVYLQTLARAARATQGQLLALCRRWWSPSPQPCRTWRQWAAKQKILSFYITVSLSVFFFCTLQLLINFPLIDDNVSEFLSIRVSYLSMEGTPLASLQPGCYTCHQIWDFKDW